MNERDAESILALDTELATALELRADEAAFRDDWRVQFAAERVMERIFQASEAVAPELREEYFGADGVKYLRACAIAYRITTSRLTTMCCGKRSALTCRS